MLNIFKSYRKCTICRNKIPSKDFEAHIIVHILNMIDEARKIKVLAKNIRDNA